MAPEGGRGRSLTNHKKPNRESVNFCDANEEEKVAEIRRTETEFENSKLVLEGGADAKKKGKKIDERKAIAGNAHQSKSPTKVFCFDEIACTLRPGSRLPFAKGIPPIKNQFSYLPGL